MMNRKEFRSYAVKHHGISGTVVDDVISHVYGPENMTRTVIEERNMPFREVDVFSRLMADRIIFLGTEIDDYIANIIQAPGGSVYAGLGIYDTMQYINPDVATICTGMAASMGAVLLCAGQKGKRTGLKHSRVMIHQPLGGARGQASDIEITAREIQKLKKELYDIIATHSGQTYDKVWGDSDRDYWMIAQEAKDFGMIDEVLAGSPATK